MKRFSLLVCLSLILVFAVAANAASDDRVFLHKAVNSTVVETSGAAKDTTDLIGPFPRATDITDPSYYLNFGNQPWNGTFETIPGACSWDGWTHSDETLATDFHWNVDTYHAVTGVYSAWCGDDIAACDPPDEEGGYGNGWLDWLDWYGTAPNLTSSTAVRLTANANIDSEPGYDQTRLQYESSTGYMEVAMWEDTFPGIVIDENFVVNPADYVGPGSDKIHLRFEFESDGGWSDEDCDFPSTGAIQLDDILVTFDGIAWGGTATFESGAWEQGWAPAVTDHVGDFAQLWSNLQEIDPCRSNYSCQVIFIDDGIVVPGTGGSQCTTWCYGPNGYIVTTEGGTGGPDMHINNYLTSPKCLWPSPQLDGCRFDFDSYRHETLSATAPGIFYVWHVRSVNTGIAADLEAAAWADVNFVYYGGPDYIRVQNNVTALMVPGRTHVQCGTGVYELGWIWGWNGSDGYPAPYFDNMRLYAFPSEGPGISTREIDIFNDAFPESGTINYGDLARNSCRVDMARNISLAAHLRNDPGDSAVWDIVPVRAGSVLEGVPVAHYKMVPNTLYDPYRLPLATEGDFAGFGGTNDVWAFDMPDTAFLFPGDVIHYYIEGQDNVGGNIGTATLPNNIDNFYDFSDGLSYNSSYTIRGLPSMWGTTIDDQPKVLLWNDFANRGLEEEWFMALRNLGYQEGAEYDVYYTNGPSSGVGNGLGGRATTDQIDGYDVLLYSSGDLSTFTLSNGDFANDAGDDVGLIDDWLLLGGKKAYFTGDDFVFDLNVNGGEATALFASYWINVRFDNQSVANLITNQVAPTVRTITGNSILSDNMEWIAYGGCLGLNTFDAVTALDGTERIAEYLTPMGVGGQYGYSALSYHYVADYTAEILHQPYDFGFVFTPIGGAFVPPKDQVDPPSSRAVLLHEILMGFGITPDSPITDTPSIEKFAARSYPNPFNPKATIAFTLPRADRVSVKLYNVRGELVKTLLDEQREAGQGQITWNGTDNSGNSVASGVYFYEVKHGSQSIVDKMTLLR